MAYEGTGSCDQGANCVKSGEWPFALDTRLKPASLLLLYTQGGPIYCHSTIIKKVKKSFTVMVKF